MKRGIMRPGDELINLSANTELQSFILLITVRINGSLWTERDFFCKIHYKVMAAI